MRVKKENNNEILVLNRSLSNFKFQVKNFKSYTFTITPIQPL